MKSLSLAMFYRKYKEQCCEFTYLISTPSEFYDQTSMANTTLKHPQASALTSTGNEMLKLYRIQKGIHPSQEPFRRGHGGR